MQTACRLPIEVGRRLWLRGASESTTCNASLQTTVVKVRGGGGPAAALCMLRFTRGSAHAARSPPSFPTSRHRTRTPPRSLPACSSRNTTGVIYPIAGACYREAGAPEERQVGRAALRGGPEPEGTLAEGPTKMEFPVRMDKEMQISALVSRTTKELLEWHVRATG